MLRFLKLCDLLQDAGENKIVIDEWIVFVSSKRVAHLVKVLIISSLLSAVK